jgi:hypothetical protein
MVGPAELKAAKSGQFSSVSHDWSKAYLQKCYMAAHSRNAQMQGASFGLGVEQKVFACRPNVGTESDTPH